MKRTTDEINEELEKARRVLDHAQDDCAGNYLDYQDIPCQSNLQRMRAAKERFAIAEVALKSLMEEFEAAWERECDAGVEYSDF